MCKITWKKKKPLESASLAHKVAKCITGNATTFASPPTEVTTLDATANNVEILHSTRKDGQVAADKFEKENELLDVKLRIVANYVDTVAKGNPDIIHLAGFESTKPTGLATQAPQTTIITKLESKPGGQINVLAKTIEDTDFYTFILVIDGEFNVSIIGDTIVIPKETNALVLSSTKKSATFKHLEPQKKVSVAVITYNAAGNSLLSPIANTSTLL